MTRTAASLLIVALLAGCSTLPRDGPSGRNVVQGASSPERAGDYALLDLDFAISERLKAAPPPSFSTLALASSDAPTDVIGVGDTLAVSIFEPGGALFGGGSNNTGSNGNQTLPPLIVNRNGAVPIPFAGEVNVQGLTPSQASAAVRRALIGKVANPQVIVTIAGNTSNAVTVLGDVRNPGRQPLSSNQDRILDVIAAAGGPSRSLHDIDVRIQRDGRVYTAPLSMVTTEFNENVRLQRGDQVNLVYKPRRFSSFGAFNAVARSELPPGPLTLAEALSGVGGLDSNLANARSVLVFRFERPEVAQALGIQQAPTTRGVPVVYRLNLNEAEGFFIASNFQMQPDDVIYAPRAGAAEMRKFFEFVQSMTRVVYDVSVTSTLNR
ncbi:polysaccharide biosynthesis/export family protein [Brevundimonas naejangsanensis]|uniref:polysaccharide biosynthesis/export family protein n=1 Tax=Brevundimonas naejangsanensis TaxID=588932 RepID=UPI000ED68077|nr:polysaccharide biosynthesis/export family protein [Brevundimonas naejangsanensis]HAC00964.1 polysaccharide biosynthesis protein [Brevundimonas sp.]HCW48965.1 polysaccharide biosynthesis protein [Brevundimonas sp.]